MEKMCIRDSNIAPGIKESHIVSNDKTGNRQNMGYVCEVDLKNTPYFVDYLFYH